MTHTLCIDCIQSHLHVCATAQDLQKGAVQGALAHVMKEPRLYYFKSSKIKPKMWRSWGKPWRHPLHSFGAVFWQLLVGFGVFVSVLHGNPSPAELSAAKASLSSLLGLPWPPGQTSVCVSNSTREREGLALSLNCAVLAPWLCTLGQNAGPCCGHL